MLSYFGSNWEKTYFSLDFIILFHKVVFLSLYTCNPQAQRIAWKSLMRKAYIQWFTVLSHTVSLGSSSQIDPTVKCRECSALEWTLMKKDWRLTQTDSYWHTCGDVLSLGLALWNHFLTEALKCRRFRISLDTSEVSCYPSIKTDMSREVAGREYGGMLQG